MLLLFLFFPHGLFIQFFFHRQSCACGEADHCAEVLRGDPGLDAPTLFFGIAAFFVQQQTECCQPRRAGTQQGRHGNRLRIFAALYHPATTVTTTMMIAAMAGIEIFATGGIGGVHRGAETTMDISADLEELAQTPVMVVCAGAKSILDLGLTLEYLETHGVPVIGYQTEELPAFYTRKSGFGVDYRLDTPAQLAEAFHVKRELGLRGGMLVTNPIPEAYSMDADVINKAIDEAVEEAKAQGIHGKATTPFLLAKIKDITGGDSLAANIQLVYNNARLATATAVELSKLRKAD